jgi:nucleoside-triphosphatase
MDLRLKILCTGFPHVGKTTLITRVLEALGDSFPASGFITEEIRGHRGRTGFQVRTLDGRTGRLAAVSAKKKVPRVGRYWVDLESFEAVALPSLELRSGISLYVIDEIGKMECFSERFVQAVQSILNTPVSVLAAIALHRGGFIEEVKCLRDVTLMEVTTQNRDSLVTHIVDMLRRSLSHPAQKS